MELLLQGLRVAFAFCLYFLAIACYLAPILAAKCWGSQTSSITSPSRASRNRTLGLKVISYGNCFAAGIFLAMCFLVLIPHANDKFELSKKHVYRQSSIPIPECIVVFGFLLTLFVEQAVLSWKEKKDAAVLRDDIEQGQGLLEECEMQDLSDDLSAIDQDGSEQNTRTNMQSHYSDSLLENPLNTNTRDSDHMSFVCHESRFLFYLLVFASVLHSVFEGIALGLQTDVPKAVHLFIAIILHQCLMASALGVNSMRLRYSFISYFKFAAIFSLSIPVGLVIGIVVEKVPGPGGELASSVFHALAAGIFLHIIFQDLLPLQFFNREDRVFKVLFIFLGFLGVASIIFFTNDV